MTTRAPILALSLLAALAGCAHHRGNTKTDNSFAGGAQESRDATRQLRGDLTLIGNGALDGAQKAAVNDAMSQIAYIDEGISVQQRANDDLSKALASCQDKQKERVFPYLIIGVAMVAIGVFCATGGGTVAFAFVGIPLVLMGIAFDVTLIFVNAITKPIEIAAYPAIGLIVAGSFYLIWHRYFRKKELEAKTEQLAVEQTATKEIVAGVEEAKRVLGPVVGPVTLTDATEAIASTQSDSTKVLVQQAKAEIATANGTT